MQTYFTECESRAWRIGPRPIPTGLKYRQGSDWFVLHHDFVEYIATSDSDMIVYLKEFYKNAPVPSEVNKKKENI